MSPAHAHRSGSSSRSAGSSRSIVAVIAFLAIALVLATAQSALASVVTGHAFRATAGFHANSRSAAASADPVSNSQLSPATEQACWQDQLSAGCENAVVADINAARAGEGVGPMTLPGGYDSLTTPQQLLVLANLERIGRGLIPARGLAGSLNAIAAVAAIADVDPSPTLTTGTALTANWAGGTPSPLIADFMWMYDDGPGSGNLDCTVSNTSGCWGHRHDVLYPFDAPLIMGAAYAPTSLDGPSLTELFIGGDTATAVGEADALLAPSWATISQSLQMALSATSLALSHGAGSGQIQVSAPGMNMNVSASISGGSGNWQVSPSSCQLAVGSSCTLTITGRPGSTGTLTLFGPAGDQTVTLANQAPTSLRMSFGRTRVTGHLAASGGAGVGGQLVSLFKRTGGRISVVARSRTRGGGSVSFRVSPRAGTMYGLAFGGSQTLGASSTAPAHAPRHARRR
jgi:hypothetical protein